jgi:hypothetical protein
MNILVPFNISFNKYLINKLKKLNKLYIGLKKNDKLLQKFLSPPKFPFLPLIKKFGMRFPKFL